MDAQQLLKAIRLNIAVLIFVCGIVTGIIGGLITATVRVSDAGHQLDDQAKGLTIAKEDIAALHLELKGIHGDMADVDRRINEGTARLSDLRRVRDGEVGNVAQRVAVLEAQLHFFADRTSTPPIAVGAKH